MDGALVVKKFILVVDDQPLIADTLALILNSAEKGFLAVSIHRAADAIGLARAIRPDLVLLDVRMPEVVGLEHALQLRDELGYPVLLISGSLTTVGILESALAAGIRPFSILAKPVHPDDLIGEIRNHFQADHRDSHPLSH